MNDVKFTGYDSVFATRLRELMSGNGTTQKDLAGVTGITRQAISQYMDGSVQPNIEKLYKICDFFEVSSDYLLGVSDVKSIDLDTKAISEKTGLSEKAVEILTGLEGVKNIRMKIERNEIEIFAERLKAKLNDSSKIDKIMNSDIEDEIRFTYILNKFIEEPSFYKVLLEFANYALKKTILVDYEKWAAEYLNNNLTDELMERRIGHNFDSLSQTNKDMSRELAAREIKDIITGVLFSNNISSGDHDYLSFMFYKEVQRMMDSIVGEIAAEARETKKYKLLYSNYTTRFERIFGKYVPSYSLDE
ncbi:helix-turn-helix domain-containing protein [Acetobacterium wieringae]|uniref:helix-turn-helix domain-containing protein n=1 Tax=Acetobacterium wieringae TaxID=52694 RepID=UPI001D7F2BF7|nr:helix-turn-helix domain-containing protein [Acetobacterium wieringae]VUZ27411.1 Uncharacterised protein [Acetobacterium wieringae]